MIGRGAIRGRGKNEPRNLLHALRPCLLPGLVRVRLRGSGMIQLSSDQEFAMSLVILLFLFLGLKEPAKRWLNRVDPLRALDGPPKEEKP